MADSIQFQELRLERVIDESTLTKSITFKGLYKGQDAVIKLEKTPFEAKTVFEALKDKQLDVHRNLINDIYSRYKLTPSTSEINDLKAIVVIPANETVLVKYSRNETIFFTESAEVYKKVVEPFIANMLKEDGNYNLWVHNILEGKSEKDHVFYDDPDESSGFMLLPSLKSSGDEKDLHVLAICHRRDIRSLRDLNDSHLPLLNNILEVGSSRIQTKFPTHNGQLRSYIHYHPTFYHFHVHFELVNASEYRASDRDNLLTTVIGNITLMPNYYSEMTLTYPLSQASALYKVLKGKDLV